MSDVKILTVPSDVQNLKMCLLYQLEKALKDFEFPDNGTLNVRVYLNMDALNGEPSERDGRYAAGVVSFNLEGK